MSLYFLALAELRTLASGYALLSTGQQGKNGKHRLTPLGDLLVGAFARTSVGYVLMPATVLKTIAEVRFSIWRVPLFRKLTGSSAVDSTAAGRHEPGDDAARMAHARLARALSRRRADRAARRTWRRALLALLRPHVRAPALVLVVILEQRRRTSELGRRRLWHGGERALDRAHDAV